MFNSVGSNTITKTTSIQSTSSHKNYNAGLKGLRTSNEESTNIMTKSINLTN